MSATEVQPSTTTTTTTAARSSFARLPAAFKLQFAVPSGMIWVPLFVFVAAWAIGQIIMYWIHSEAGGNTIPETEAFYSGASQATIWCLIFVAAYAASNTFPFSMALSFSRRLFMMGVFLAFGAVSAGYGLAFGLAAWVERVTDGYGIHTYTFDLPYLTDGPGGILSAVLMAAVVTLMLMLFGFFWAMLFKRFGLVVTWGVIIAVVLGLAGAVFLISQFGDWADVGLWILDRNALQWAGLCALGALALGVANYGLIRRATAA